VRYCPFLKFHFVTMLIRSGLSILADYPAAAVSLFADSECSDFSISDQAVHGDGRFSTAVGICRQVVLASKSVSILYRGQG
jgi:hypothetical protein